MTNLDVDSTDYGRPSSERWSNLPGVGGGGELIKMHVLRPTQRASDFNGSAIRNCI